MPRDLPLGNGKLLVNFDRSYQMRDLFFPHVGMENHLTGHPCRFGVWVDGVFSWVSDDRWRRTLIYEPDATVTAVRLECDNPRIAIRVTDVVDFAVNLMVRKFVVERGSGRDVRLFLHHDFHIYGHPIGDTALYRETRSCKARSTRRSRSIRRGTSTKSGRRTFGSARVSIWTTSSCCTSARARIRTSSSTGRATIGGCGRTRNRPTSARCRRS